MEKKQYELCLEILRRFNKADILKHFILIGSWCVVFYKDYFESNDSIGYAAIKTRDIDFLISAPSRIQSKVDIPALLQDLGFVAIFRGQKGYIKDLILEFLVPEKGRGTNRRHMPCRN